MKKKNTLIAVSAAVITTSVLLLYTTKKPNKESASELNEIFQSSDEINAQNTNTQSTIQQILIRTNAENAIHTAEKALALASAPDIKKDISENNSEAWKVFSGEKTQKPSITLHSQIKTFDVVHLNPHPEHLPSEGEQIILPMLDGTSVKVNVETTQTTDNGDYIWSGHLAGNDNDYPVVMTYGETLTFATITTPQGSYSMESSNGLGWLYKNPGMNEFSKPGSKDILIPPI